MSTQSQAIVKPDENFKEVVKMLDQSAIKKQIDAALSNVRKFVNQEYLVRVALTALRGDWKLMVADPTTVIGSIIQLGQVGLVPDGFLGQAYLVPFKIKNSRYQYEAVPMVGYRGYGELAVRSGRANSVDAEVVKEGDYFDFRKGDNPFIHHKRLFGQPRGKMLGAYAVVYMKEGPARFEIMDMEDLLKIQGASRGSDSSDSPWKNWFEEMCRKSPMRRLAKWVPLSPEFQMAAGIDENSELGKRQTTIDGATGEVVVVPAGFTTDEPAVPIERPTRASATTVAQAAVAEPTTEGASNGGSTAQRQPAPASSGCFCSCCKGNACNCNTKEEFDRCGCAPCKGIYAEVKKEPANPTVAVAEQSTAQDTSAGAGQPSGSELFGPPPGQGPSKPSGPYITQKQVAKLVIAAKASGVEMKKDDHTDLVHQMLAHDYGIASMNEIPTSVYEEILKKASNIGPVKVNAK